MQLNSTEFKLVFVDADSFDCGIAHFENGRKHRIVGGTNVFGWKYPWYGALIHAESGQLACGANLISSKHLLTAAHCYDDYRKWNENSNLLLQNQDDINSTRPFIWIAI